MTGSEVDSPSTDSPQTYTREAMELLRTRELYKYYEPSTTPAYSEDEEHEPTLELSSSSDADDAPAKELSRKPLTAGDPVLGSLVLLAERLLQADRALVIFADQHREYLIADSGQAIGHFTGETGPPENVPIPGSWKRRAQGRVDLFSVFLDTPMRKKTPRTVMEVLHDDLVEDDKWKHCWLGVKQYIGMPLVTKMGSVIGVLCACYKKPRSLDVDREPYRRTFNALTRAVYRYMDVVRGEREKKRGRKMEIALSRFIAGNYSPDKIELMGSPDGSLRVETASQESERRDDERKDATTQRRKKEKQRWTQRDAKRKAIRKKKGEPTTPETSPEVSPRSAVTTPSKEGTNPGRQTQSYFDERVSWTPPGGPGIENKSSEDEFIGNYGVHFKAPHDRSPPPAPAKNKRLGDKDSPKAGFDPSFLMRNERDAYFLPDDESTQRIRKGSKDSAPNATTIGSLPINVAAHHRALFMRAARLMHKAMDLDGVAFVNSDLEGLSDFDVADTTSPLNHTSSDAKSKEDVRGARSRNSKLKSGILGFSATRPATSPGAAGVDASELTEEYLRYITESWPRGCVFAWSKDPEHPVIEVCVDPEGTSDVEGHLVHDAPENLETISVLRRFLPGSRSVIFIPLYDFVGKVFAIGFAWTNSGVRVLRGDVEGSFMAAFCDSIMTEVSRLQSVSANVAKGNFISTISHELRSPLHGILASCEFFRESILSDYERDLIGTITSCGKTLLDTIENVLSFTKLNTRANVRKGTRDNFNRRAGNHIDALVHQHSSDIMGDPKSQNVDLAGLVEEVVEAAYVGYKFSPTPEPQRPTSKRGSHHSDFNKEDLYVTLEIDPEVVKRRYVVAPGAFRRVVLNLTTNALKYTDDGWVRLRLMQENETTVLRIADSGRGISREFLKNSLFTPFMQEMNLHSGTGLGMSIVRQLVDELHGKIDVRSQVDVGTEVCVSVSLESIIAPDEELESSYIFEARHILQGKRVCLVGFDVQGDDTPQGSMELRGPGDALRGLRSFLKYTLTKHLGVTVVPAQAELEGLDVSNVDVAITRAGVDLERFVSALENHDHIPILELGRGRLGRPASPGSPTRIRNKIISCSRPYGPRKIASTLIYATRGDDIPPPIPPPSVTPRMESPKASTVTPALEHATPPRSNSSTPSNLASSRSPSSSNTSVSNTGQPIRPATQSSAWLPTGEANELPTVLLVEDNKINMKLLATFFARAGYVYTEAANGLQAVNMVKENGDGFDVIMMDLQMPIMTGVQATREIRILERKRKTPRSIIIALTALSGDEAKIEAKRAGTDMFLVKPVQIKDLREIMKKLGKKKVGDMNSRVTGAVSDLAEQGYLVDGLGLDGDTPVEEKPLEEALDRKLSFIGERSEPEGTPTPKETEKKVDPAEQSKETKVDNTESVSSGRIMPPSSTFGKAHGKAILTQAGGIPSLPPLASKTHKKSEVIDSPKRAKRPDAQLRCNSCNNMTDGTAETQTVSCPTHPLGRRVVSGGSSDGRGGNH